MTRRTIKSISLNTLDYLELLMFCEKMSQLVGIDMNNLLGLTNVKLKNAEIQFENCNFSR